MPRVWCSSPLVALTLSLVFGASGIAEADGFGKTLVLATDARVYATASFDAPVLATLPHGALVHVQRKGAEWCVVYISAPPGVARGINGAMRCGDLVQSAGLAAFGNKQFSVAASLLSDEVRATDDPLIGSWLQFFLGYAHWAAGGTDRARETFEAITARRPSVPLGADAFVAQAKLAWSEGRPDAAIAAYERMLVAYPDFRGRGYVYDFSIDSAEVEWDSHAPIRLGDGQIQRRLVAARRLVAVTRSTEATLQAQRSTPIQRASAWLALGRAWEAKNEVDPGRVGIVYIPDQTEARQAYEAAIAAAPGSASAGSAAWRLIAFSEPYEWEGMWEDQSAWNITEYGAFRDRYPSHELGGEALFKIATARWVQAGYTEVYRYFSAPDLDAYNGRKRQLDAWFDTTGFGGGTGGGVVPQHPEQTATALKLFREVVAKYPATESAAMAQYYIAVILDYCLGQGESARPEYEAFIRKYPKAEPYVGKARERLRISK
jgi:tetratricopeptide (TPR) repeat protein